MSTSRLCTRTWLPIPSLATSNCPSSLPGGGGRLVWAHLSSMMNVGGPVLCRSYVGSHSYSKGALALSCHQLWLSSSILSTSSSMRVPNLEIRGLCAWYKFSTWGQELQSLFFSAAFDQITVSTRSREIRSISEPSWELHYNFWLLFLISRQWVSFIFVWLWFRFARRSNLLSWSISVCTQNKTMPCLLTSHCAYDSSIQHFIQLGVLCWIKSWECITTWCFCYRSKHFTCNSHLQKIENVELSYNYSTFQKVKLIH